MKKNIYSNIVYCFRLIVVLGFILNLNKISNAELSYSFSGKKTTNGLTEQQKKTLKYYFENDEDTYYNFNKENNNNNNNNDKDNDNSNKKIQPTGDRENEVKLNIGGLAEAQYFYTTQSKEYQQDILPNGLRQSPVEIQNYSVVGDKKHTLNVLGKITINPEFIRYKTSDGINKIEKERLLTVGAKITQPFYNASKNTDPRLVPEEYIYIKTKYLHFQIGATNSAGARMRVDAQKIASGNGGVFGTWWRYISLPVFNTSAMLSSDRNVLNFMSPVYLIYPTLPNEAGFTVQRALVGRQLINKDFPGGNVNALTYGSQAQGYPTQGAYSNKISMYLPRIKGFSVGVSYSPNTSHTGFITHELNKGTQTYNNINGGFLKHYTSVAMDYRKQWDKYGLGVAFSISYEYGKFADIKYSYDLGDANYISLNLADNKYLQRNDLNAFAIGAQIVYKNYSIAYSFGYWGKSLLNKYNINVSGAYQVPTQTKKSYYHTAGIGANYGPVRLGLTYMHSNYAGNKVNVVSFGTDFKMISMKYLRVNPYFEVTGYFFDKNYVKLFANSDTIFSVVKNKGVVITLGMRILF